MQKRELQLTEELDEFWKTSQLLARERQKEEKQLKSKDLQTVKEEEEDLDQTTDNKEGEDGDEVFKKTQPEVKWPKN